MRSTTTFEISPMERDFSNNESVIRVFNSADRLHCINKVGFNNFFLSFFRTGLTVSCYLTLTRSFPSIIGRPEFVAAFSNISFSSHKTCTKFILTHRCFDQNGRYFYNWNFIMYCSRGRDEFEFFFFFCSSLFFS